MLPSSPDTKVLAAIFARHEGPEWVRFAEVANSTGAQSSRRADAVCMNIWPSKGFAIHGFEIKVSRSDFIHEMKDITKVKAVGRFCDFWWLTTPAGLVSPNEVPESWGLMELHKNGLKIKKQARQNEVPDPITRGFMASLLRKSRDTDDRYVRTQVEALAAKIREQESRTFESRLENLKAKVDRQAEWIKAFEAKLGVRFESYLTPENMVERMKLAENLRIGPMNRLSKACQVVLSELSTISEPEELDDL